VPILNERAGFPQGTELMLFEEIKPNTVERIQNMTDPLEKVNSLKYKYIQYEILKSIYRAWTS